MCQLQLPEDRITVLPADRRRRRLATKRRKKETQLNRRKSQIWRFGSVAGCSSLHSTVIQRGTVAQMIDGVTTWCPERWRDVGRLGT